MTSENDISIQSCGVGICLFGHALAQVPFKLASHTESAASPPSSTLPPWTTAGTVATGLQNVTHRAPRAPVTLPCAACAS
jgi:hypothetical protein